MKNLLTESLIAGVAFLGLISLLNIAVLPLVLSSSYAINSLVVTFYTFLITAPIAFLVGYVSWWGCSRLRPLWRYTLLGMVCCANLYVYGNLNPTHFIDPHGLDAKVLNESKGAFRAGHQGLAVQGAAGWIYISQDGPWGGGGHTAYYNNQEEMMRDLGGRYDRHFLIQTTTQQDAAIYQSASVNLNTPYSANPFNKNRFHCGDLVSTALRAGSVPTGAEPFGNRPNASFNNIRTANTPQPSSTKSSTFSPQSGLNGPSPVTSFPSQTINRSSQGPLK